MVYTVNTGVITRCVGLYSSVFFGAPYIFVRTMLTMPWRVQCLLANHYGYGLFPRPYIFETMVLTRSDCCWADGRLSEDIRSRRDRVSRDQVCALLCFLILLS